MELITLFLSAILINNIILVKFLGICPLMGVSTKTSSALGMGAAVTFVIFCSSMISYFLYHYVLDPLSIEYMSLIVFILVIASFVQFTEMMIKYSFPTLYKSLGIYLPLITTNCAVLYAANEIINQQYTFVETIVYSIAVPIGFTMVLYIFSTLRERMSLSSPPKAFQGNPIALIVAGIMALALSGLAGIV